LRILAFDTATRASTVALAGFTAETLEARDDPPPGERPGHVARLLGLIAEVMDHAGANWDSLDRIAVGTGPGTFTGLRIGVATARALTTAAHLPLVGVSTLESLARGARSEAAADGRRIVLAVLDARRGEAFAAAWRVPGGERIIAPAPLGPESLGEHVRRLGESPLTVGDGAVAFRAVLESAGAFVPPDGSVLHRVSATVHTEIAADLPAADPHEVQPEYLRLPDAELARRAAS
jgi:tRNA threonylcarbamoyladenosine biosynthesis protein TsaB